MSSRPLGYSALVQGFGLRAPPLRATFFAGSGSALTHVRSPDGSERTSIPESRVSGAGSITDELTFAFKREALDLTVLAALFEQPPALAAVQSWLDEKPGSVYARRAGHLAAWLCGAEFVYRLPPGTPRVSLLDAAHYVCGPERPDRRFGVVNNLLGTKAFSPLVRKTPTLQRLLDAGLAARVNVALAGIEPEVLQRAVDYLYLSETRSTYDLEHEIPDNNRAAQFRQLLEAAGEPGELTEAQLVRWQNRLFDAFRAEPAFRERQNWLSRPGRLRNIADYIPPPASELAPMMAGIAEVAAYAASAAIDPVLAAACASFGLVFAHPFYDGNGRLHRFLIHHLLRQSGFTPPGVVLPVSAQMLKRLDAYAQLLRRYSRPRTDLLQYRLDADSQTIHVTSPQPRWLYAYFDATEICEFVLECCERSLDEDLAGEVQYLRAYDATVRELETWLDMRQSKLATLIDLIVQGHGALSRRKRAFAAELTEAQLGKVLTVVRKHFGL